MPPYHTVVFCAFVVVCVRACVCLCVRALLGGWPGDKTKEHIQINSARHSNHTRRHRVGIEPAHAPMPHCGVLRVRCCVSVRACVWGCVEDLKTYSQK